MEVAREGGGGGRISGSGGEDGEVFLMEEMVGVVGEMGMVVMEGELARMVVESVVWRVWRGRVGGRIAVGRGRLVRVLMVLGMVG